MRVMRTRGVILHLNAKHVYYKNHKLKNLELSAVAKLSIVICRDRFAFYKNQQHFRKRDFGSQREVS